MTRRLLALSGVVISAALAAGCGNDGFPVSPTPLATSPVVVQGTKYQGNILLSTGGTTSFNMTLIARELSGAARVTLQAANAPAVTGNFETGSGLRGTVQGTLTGSLDNGFFDGSMTASSAGHASEQRYSGPITTASAALAPGDCVQGTCAADGLTGAIQAVQSPTPNGPPPPPPCSYALSPPIVSVGGSGGTASATVTATPNTCAWAAVSTAPWITIVPPAAGTGVGTVTFTVQANPGEQQRSGSLRIADQTLTVIEGAGASVSGPAITTQPQSQAIAPGTAATLSVAATGAAPLGYQWYVGTSGTTTTPIAGATASSFTTPALTSTTSYWVRVTNPGGSVDSNTATITVGINVPPTIGSFTANPTTITAGQSATLAWSAVANATTCSINNGVGTVSCGNATATVTPTTTTTYTLTATGPGGTASATASVGVGALPSPPPVIGSFTASPTPINPGQPSTLTWSGVANAATCAIDNGVGTVPCSDGTRTVTPATTTTYTLTATGPGGSTSRTAAVTVGPPAVVIGSFTASPTPINPGQPSTLTWSGIANAATCAIDNGVGTVPCSDGTRTVTPATTTTYTLTATGPGGSTSRTATVTLRPVIGSFTASPTTITAGQPATLTWSGITNATTCSIDNGVGTVSCSNGTRNVTPTTTTTYTLTATAPGVSPPTTATTTVTVTSAPRITVTPQSGTRPVTFTVTGTGFTPGGMANVTVVRTPGGGIEHLVPATVDGVGGFAATFRFETLSVPGTFNVTATDQRTGVVTTPPVQITLN